MTEKLTCFKCWNQTATLTYEENRIYKVSCQCGHIYEFEHSSWKCAEEYHNLMLELYTLKAENEQLKNIRDILLQDISPDCDLCVYQKIDTNQEPCLNCRDYVNFKYAGLEATT